MFCLRRGDRVPHLSRTDLAEAKVRRQARRAGESGPIAVLRIAVQAVIDESRELAPRRVLPPRPVAVEASRPIGAARLERQIG